MSIRTTNIRALKDRLSATLREVQQGDVVLVTDRGRVVAEIRKPTIGAQVVDSQGEREQRLVAAGALRLGLPNGPKAYRSTRVHLPTSAIDAALEWTRGESEG